MKAFRWVRLTHKGIPSLKSVHLPKTFLCVSQTVTGPAEAEAASW